MRIAFLGTPEFAVPSLSKLIEQGHEIFVFTQPDRPKGRGYEPEQPPVKILALEKGLPVFQFDKIKSAEGIETLKKCMPDLMVTAAFGQILSKENLDIPKYGCINVHGSLLPKYRGAAPIQWAVINGEKKTGITTMLTDLGVDTGDILRTAETEILPDETAGELYERLSVLGAQVLLETISVLEAGRLQKIPQDEARATHCPMLKKEHGKIDWTRAAQQIHNLVRGVNPWPGAYTMYKGAVLKIWKTSMTERNGQALPGECFIADAKAGLYVGTGEGLLRILELQAPGGKRMEAEAYLRGKPLQGAVLE